MRAISKRTIRTTRYTNKNSVSEAILFATDLQSAVDFNQGFPHDKANQSQSGIWTQVPR